MTNQGKALLWAGAIIAAAIIASAIGMSDSASIGVVGGLSGAAWASLAQGKACGRSCWQ